MEVHFDSQTFMRQRSGGISRLFTDLISQFDARPELGVTASIPFRWSNNAHITTDLAPRHLRMPPSWVPRGVLYAPNFVMGSRISRSAEILHHTYYGRRFLKRPGRLLQVTTVYDMIPELFAGTPGSTGTHLSKQDYVAKCDLVICISESTRQDLLQTYGNIARKVVTIPLSVSKSFNPFHPPLARFPKDYLLYVGKREGYKDFRLLPQAVAALRDDGIDIPVIVVGSPFTDRELDALTQFGLMRSFTQVRLSDTELAKAYAHATALVQTSSYEGFGLTPLEGMASGAPVVIANASSMPEVGGDAGIYFTPGDADDLAQNLASLLADDRARTLARAKGLQQARLFTPELMAQRTADAYGSLLHNEHGDA